MGILDNILNTVNEGIGKAVEKANAAAQEANAKAEAEGKALTEEEKEKRLNQIEIDICHLEEMIKNDLEYRNMLIP